MTLAVIGTLTPNTTIKINEFIVFTVSASGYGSNKHVRPHSLAQALAARIHNAVLKKTKAKSNDLTFNLTVNYTCLLK